MNKKTLYKLASKDMIKSYNIAYIIIVSLVSLLELYMLISKYIKYGISNDIFLIYNICYLGLYIMSSITAILLVISRKSEKVLDSLTKFIYVYCSFLIIWSGTIGILDVYRGNTPIVFLTIIVMVAAVTLLKPLIYGIVVAPFAGVIIYLLIQSENTAIDSKGYIINFFIFVLFGVLLTMFQYRLKMRSFSRKLQLEKLSYFDPLTGIYNRNSLHIQLGDAKELNFHYFGVIDVDNFKKINDTYGHDVGDEFLVEIAALIKEGFGEKVYRYGGDEFVAVIKASEVEIEYVFNSINKTLKEKHSNIDVHVSAGFYLIQNENEELLDCFKKADNALYEAKDAGKKKLVFYEEDIQ